MAYVAVDKDGTEWIYESKPKKENDIFCIPNNCCSDEGTDTNELPKGSIKKLIGRTLSWEDEPVELEETTEEGD